MGEGGGGGGRKAGGEGGSSGAGTGDAGQPGEVVRAANLAKSVAEERAMYRASQDAFFKEKDYTKAKELENKYNAMHAANEKTKLEQATKKVNINWSKVGTKPGSSVREENLNKEYAARSARNKGKGPGRF